MRLKTFIMLLFTLLFKKVILGILEIIRRSSKYLLILFKTKTKLVKNIIKKSAAPRLKNKGANHQKLVVCTLAQSNNNFASKKSRRIKFPCKKLTFFTLKRKPNFTTSFQSHSNLFKNVPYHLTCNLKYYTYSKKVKVKKLYLKSKIVYDQNSHFYHKDFFEHHNLFTAEEQIAVHQKSNSLPFFLAKKLCNEKSYPNSSLKILPRCFYELKNDLNYEPDYVIIYTLHPLCFGVMSQMGWQPKFAPPPQKYLDLTDILISSNNSCFHIVCINVKVKNITENSSLKI